MKTIDCFIIGAHKCGSTSLFKVITQHPKVKSHFGNQLEEYLTADDYLERYNNILTSQYKIDGKGILLARDMTVYLNKESLTRLYTLNPHAKLILIIREPVSRAISAYNYSVTNGFFKKEKTLKEIIDDYNSGKYATEILLINRFLDAGFYFKIITSILEIFPKNQLLIIKLDDFSTNQQLEANKIFDYLNLSRCKVIEHYSNKLQSRKSLYLHKHLRDKHNFIKSIMRIIIPKHIRVKLFHQIIDYNSKGDLLSMENTVDIDKLRLIYQDDLNLLKLHYNIHF